MRKTLTRGAAIGALFALSACGSAGSTGAGGSTTTESPGPSTGGFPVSVQSCQEKITLDKAPQRVMVMGATGVAAMNDLGVLDRMVVHSGNIDLSVFPAAVKERVESLPTLTGKKSDSGGDTISTEAILEQRVDLVIGYDSGADRSALAKAGVPLYSPAAFCPDYRLAKADFGLVYREVGTIATLFGVTDKAPAVNEALKKVVPQPTKVDPSATAATLYITPGVQKMWAYGPSSMVQPIMEANGLTNVYADQEERVPEMSVEDLLKRDPKTIIILHGEGTADQALNTFMGFKGVDAMAAVRTKRVVIIPFALTDPPSPLSIQGAIVLKEKLAALP